MIKVLFLLIIFIFKLNAYDFLVYRYNPNVNDDRNTFYSDPSGELVIKTINNGVTNYQSITSVNSWNILHNLVQRDSWVGHGNFVGIEKIHDYFKEDNKFINDFYISNPQLILNFLYNTNHFSFENYINYQDYQLLYNSDGFAVESIVDGVWAGLYSDSEKGASGKLYSSSGVLLYVNGDPVSMFEQWFDPVVRSVVGCLKTAVDLIASPVGVVVSVVFVMAILYFVVWLGRRSLRVKDGF